MNRESGKTKNRLHCLAWMLRNVNWSCSNEKPEFMNINVMPDKSDCLYLVVQLLSHIWLSVTPRTSAHQVFLSFTISRSLLTLRSIELVVPSNHLILSCPIVLLPSIFSSIRVFSNESTLLIWWPKYWSFSFKIIPPMIIQSWFPLELTGLISWQSKGLQQFKNISSLALNLLYGLKSLLQHHSSKTSILWHSTFFMVQLTNPYMTTGKTSFDYTTFCCQSDISAF